MTLAARAIQHRGEPARLAHVCSNRAGWISCRIRVLGANELRGGKDDDEDDGGLLQSSAHGSIKSFDEGKPLELFLHVVRFHQVDELWYRLSVHGHEVVVRVVLEQLRSSFEDVSVVLNQPFRSRVGLPYFALGAVAAQKPVIAQRVCVLFLGDSDALGRLFLESVQLSRSNRHVCADFKRRHRSSYGLRFTPQTNTAILLLRNKRKLRWETSLGGFTSSFVTAG